MDDQVAVADADRLARFFAMASRAGIRVMAVEGDPHAILPHERVKFVRRAQARMAHNQAVVPESRLTGIQYDIEPYLVPGLAFDPAGWQTAYAETLAALRRAVGSWLEIAVPFWWAHTGHALLDRVAPSIDGLTVMNYRTDLRQIEQAVEPLLSWGVRHGKPVRIGLEAGPLPDEIRRGYRRAEAGEVWLVTVASRDVLVLMREPMPNPLGVAWRQVSERPVQAAQTTFHGDQARFDSLLPEVERRLAPWPSSNGVAIHGLF